MQVIAAGARPVLRPRSAPVLHTPGGSSPRSMQCPSTRPSRPSQHAIPGRQGPELSWPLMCRRQPRLLFAHSPFAGRPWRPSPPSHPSCTPSRRPSAGRGPQRPAPRGRRDRDTRRRGLPLPGPPNRSLDARRLRPAPRAPPAPPRARQRPAREATPALTPSLRYRGENVYMD